MFRRVVVLLAAFCLVACGSSGGHPKPTPTSTASYLSAVRSLYPSTNTDADLLRGGDSKCAALGAGVSAATLTDQVGSTTLGAERTRAKKDITAAIRFLCPEFKAQLPIGD